MRRTNDSVPVFWFVWTGSFDLGKSLMFAFILVAFVLKGLMEIRLLQSANLHDA